MNLELIFCISQTSAGAVILTDIVFWCVIVPFLSISRFKLNMVCALLPYIAYFFFVYSVPLMFCPRIPLKVSNKLLVIYLIIVGTWKYHWLLLICTWWQLMGCMHTLNAIFLLLDTMLNNLVSNTLTGVQHKTKHQFYITLRYM